MSTRDEVNAMLSFVDKTCGPVLSSIHPRTGARHRPLEEWQGAFAHFRESTAQNEPYWPCKTQPANELFRILSAEDTSKALRRTVGRFEIKLKILCY